MKTIRIATNDNVEVMLEGDKRGHKLAACPIAAGEKVIKYGHSICVATQDIAAGEWVHSHNLKTGLETVEDYAYDPIPCTLEPKIGGSFLGFERANSGVGIRNELWILPTVGCVAKTAERIACKASELYSFSLQSGCSGIYAFPHPYGCSQLGEDHENTQKLLSGLLHNPNAGGVLVLGLGCENNRLENLRPMLGEYDTKRVRFMECQQFEDEEAEALRLIDELMSVMQQDKRTPQPAEKLVLGMKCGGSDGLSGITANPLVGRITDRLIAEGGSAMLTEVPEMFGAETVLLERCVDEGIFTQAATMLTDFKNYYISHNLPCYENPSPGNKDGGITTLEEKSLGCVCKGGSAPVVDVLSYGERVKKKGLSLLNGPGNDLVAATALAASGANLILFTTGRGTPFGCPVPTVKISTNSPLFAKKSNWIDFDAGRMVDGMPLDRLTDELYAYILALASGEITTKTEQNGYRDIAIFKTGVTL